MVICSLALLLPTRLLAAGGRTASHTATSLTSPTTHSNPPHTPNAEGDDAEGYADGDGHGDATPNATPAHRMMDTAPCIVHSR